MKGLHLKDAKDAEFVPALNEKLTELERRVDRQAERYQRIDDVVISVAGGVGDREVKHSLGVIPTLVVVELRGITAPYFKRPHTKTSVYLRVNGAASDVTVNLVLRG